MLADRKKRKFFFGSFFLGQDGNCWRNMLDLEDCLLTSSRSSGQLQRRPDSQTSNASNAARAEQTADAANQQCKWSECSSPSCTANVGGQLHRVCTAVTKEHSTSTARPAADGTDHSRTGSVSWSLLITYTGIAAFSTCRSLSVMDLGTQRQWRCSCPCTTSTNVATDSVPSERQDSCEPANTVEARCTWARNMLQDRGRMTVSCQEHGLGCSRNFLALHLPSFLLI